MTLHLDLGAVQLDLEPGQTRSIEIRSFTAADRTYALNVTLDRTGLIHVACRCPQHIHRGSCKHDTAAERLLATHPDVADTPLRHLPTRNDWLGRNAHLVAEPDDPFEGLAS